MNTSNDNLTRIRTHSADATRALGGALGTATAAVNADHTIFIALNGELGAGKTTFVSGFMRAMGVTQAIRSPTYTLIETYELPLANNRRVHHLDLYRLAAASELEMLAPRDLLEPGAILLVEWAEKGRGVLPIPDLQIDLGYPAPGGGKDERILEIIPGSSSGKVLAASLHRSPD